MSSIATADERANSPTQATHHAVEVLPMDEHNRRLVANAHPAEYRNPRAERGRYNLVVIGAGTAGLVGSIATAGMGGKSALIKRHLLGGDCLNFGCVPSKSIIRSARVIGELRRAAELGVHVPEGVRVDFAAVMARMRGLRAEISHDDSMARLQREGVAVFLGEARFTGPDTVEVFDGAERQTLRFAKALIATGGRARELPLPGLAEAGYLTNETLFQLTEQPRRLAVIGGGPIGAEMAQTFARFGTAVTIFIKDNAFLPKGGSRGRGCGRAGVAPRRRAIHLRRRPAASHGIGGRQDPALRARRPDRPARSRRHPGLHRPRA